MVKEWCEAYLEDEDTRYCFKKHSYIANCDGCDGDKAEKEDEERLMIWAN